MSAASIRKAFIHFQKHGVHKKNAILGLLVVFMRVDEQKVYHETIVSSPGELATCFEQGLVPIRRLPFGKGYAVVKK